VVDEADEARDAGCATPIADSLRTEIVAATDHANSAHRHARDFPLLLDLGDAKALASSWKMLSTGSLNADKSDSRTTGGPTYLI
jgi:hypothetical protein